MLTYSRQHSSVDNGSDSRFHGDPKPLNQPRILRLEQLLSGASPNVNKYLVANEVLQHFGLQAPDTPKLSAWDIDNMAINQQYRANRKHLRRRVFAVVEFDMPTIPLDDTHSATIMQSSKTCSLLQSRSGESNASSIQRQMMRRRNRTNNADPLTPASVCSELSALAIDLAMGNLSPFEVRDEITEVSAKMVRQVIASATEHFSSSRSSSFRTDQEIIDETSVFQIYSQNQQRESDLPGSGRAACARNGTMASSQASRGNDLLPRTNTMSSTGKSQDSKPESSRSIGAAALIADEVLDDITDIVSRHFESLVSYQSQKVASVASMGSTDTEQRPQENNSSMKSIAESATVNAMMSVSQVYGDGVGREDEEGEGKSAVTNEGEKEKENKVGTQKLAQLNDNDLENGTVDNALPTDKKIAMQSLVNDALNNEYVDDNGDDDNDNAVDDQVQQQVEEQPDVTEKNAEGIIEDAQEHEAIGISYKNEHGSETESTVAEPVGDNREEADTEQQGKANEEEIEMPVSGRSDEAEDLKPEQHGESEEVEQLQQNETDEVEHAQKDEDDYDAEDEKSLRSDEGVDQE